MRRWVVENGFEGIAVFSDRSEGAELSDGADRVAYGNGGYDF